MIGDKMIKKLLRKWIAEYLDGLVFNECVFHTLCDSCPFCTKEIECAGQVVLNVLRGEENV